MEDPTFDEALYNSKKWMTECTTTHEPCGVAEPPVLPKRVVEIQEQCIRLKGRFDLLTAVSLSMSEGIASEPRLYALVLHEIRSGAFSERKGFLVVYV